MTKILVLMPNGIRDSFMAFPLLNLIRQRYGQTALLTVIVPEHLKPLYAYQKYTDNILTHSQKSRWRSLLKLIFLLRKEAFDIGFLCPNSFSSALLLTLGCVKKRVGYSKEGRSIFLHERLPLPRYTSDKHRMRVYMALALASWKGRAPQEVSVDIVIPSEDREKMNATLRQKLRSTGQKLVAFGVASHNKTKDWSVERYKALGLALRKTHPVKILLLGSRKDSLKAQFIARGSSGVFVDLTEQTDLKSVQVILSLCSLFVGGDSGLTHIASMLGVPTVVLFGSTTPRYSCPQGETVKVISSEEECSPCFQQSCPLGTNDCMKNIRLQDVLDSAQTLLSKELSLLKRQF